MNAEVAPTELKLAAKRTHGGYTVWEGAVAVFDLAKHLRATRAYAWSSPIEGSENCRFHAVGADHTQTIEGFWSVVERGMIGTFHKVSAKYLPLCVAEFQFRYNNRSNPLIFGEAMRGC